MRSTPAIIAGNAPEDRLDRLQEFWRRVKHGTVSQLLGSAPWFGVSAAKAMTFTEGVRGFFEPNPLAWFNPFFRIGAEEAGYLFDAESSSAR